jgi:L-ascorbate metabolism protein UlaG (beta-lactamase superfamily)
MSTKKNNSLFPSSHILLFIFISCSIYLAGVENPSPTPYLGVTYIANSGFLLESETKKVLIDAIFIEGYGVYQSPSKDNCIRIVNGDPPFDDIDIILVSHSDPDHFDSLLTARCLQNNPNTILICPEQAYRLLSKEEDFSKISLQVKHILPDLDSHSQIEIKGAHIHAFRFKHSEDEKESKQNLGYLINLDRKKIIHLGDAGFHEWHHHSLRWLRDEQIDIALIPFWFLQTEEARGVIKNIISPRHIILMHITPNNIYGEFQLYLEHKPQFANMTVFKKSMDKKIFR